MQTNIYAYTANTNPYPEYVSLNERDGRVVLSVREPAKPGPHSSKDCGSTTEVVLPYGELRKLFEALRDRLTPPMTKAMGGAI